MDVTLAPELEEQIKQKVESGQYTSADEVLNEAVRWFLEQNHPADPLPLDELRREIALADAQFERGEYKTYDSDSLHTLFDEIKAEGMKRLAERQRNTTK